jgi:hypothetical protein
MSGRMELVMLLKSVLSVEAVPEDVEHTFQGNFFFKLPMFLISLH